LADVALNVKSDEWLGFVGVDDHGARHGLLVARLFQPVSVSGSSRSARSGAGAPVIVVAAERPAAFFATAPAASVERAPAAGPTE